MLKKCFLILFLFEICSSSLFSSITPASMKYDQNAGIGGGAGGGSAGLGKGSKGQAPKGGHQKNIRPSTKQKHENADARRQKEQRKAEEKRANGKKKK